MTKLKGSFGAKFAAWLVFTVSIAVFYGSILGAYFFVRAGIYDTRQQDMQKSVMEDVSRRYSIRALANMESGENGEYFKDKLFQYGIIRADSLKGLDLNDEETYVERNFTQKVTEDELYTAEWELSDDWGYYDSESLFGRYGIYDNGGANLVSRSLDEVIYAVDEGIYYYRSGDLLYPVQNVSVAFTVEQQEIFFEFVFDFQRNAYRNSNPFEARAEAAVSESSVKELVRKESTAETELRSADMAEAGDPAAVLGQEFVTFNMFDHTSQSYESFRLLQLDGREYSISGQIAFKGKEEMEQLSVTGETDYYLENKDAIIVNEGTSEKQSYQVVSILPENIGHGSSSDLYVQANTLVRLAYELRYSIYLIMAVSFLAAAAMLVFLISAAGYRKGSDEVRETFLDRIPSDLYLCIALTIEAVPLMAVFTLGYGSQNLAVMIILTSCILLFMTLFGLLSILSLSVRIKKKTLFSNSLIGRIVRLAGKGLSYLKEHISILWKAVLLTGAIAFIELLVILITRYELRAELMFWLLEKALLVPALFLCIVQMAKLQEGSRRIADGDLSHQIELKNMFWEFRKHGSNLNSISEGMSLAVEERMKSERFKTELITNVSHDIKTPLTSIINYVDLLEKEELQNENAEEYLEVLDRQSARLKKLIEDLMEASKASTGSLPVQFEKLEAGVFLVQTVGEFEEKMSECSLELIMTHPGEEAYIMADGRHFWRVIDNLMNNICKYAQPGTRVYVNMEVKDQQVVLIFRNTSKYPLNISSEELMERFVRGDSSRNTEGSGLGLSIARSLMELMKGTFELHVDGDLFKVVIGFAQIDCNSNTI